MEQAGFEMPLGSGLLQTKKDFERYSKSFFVKNANCGDKLGMPRQSRMLGALGLDGPFSTIIRSGECECVIHKIDLQRLSFRYVAFEDLCRQFVGNFSLYDTL